MSKQITAAGDPTVDLSAVIATAVATAIKAVQPTPPQVMSVEAFQAMEGPRPLIPTYQIGMEVNTRGFSADAIRKMGLLQTGTYLDGLVRVTRREPTAVDAGRIDISYDASRDGRLQLYSRVRSFQHLVDEMLAELEAVQTVLP